MSACLGLHDTVTVLRPHQDMLMRLPSLLMGTRHPILLAVTYVSKMSAETLLGQRLLCDGAES